MTEPLTPFETAAFDALTMAKRMIDEALPKFNWGASALDANAIRLLNETPVAVNAALAVYLRGDGRTP